MLTYFPVVIILFLFGIVAVLGVTDRRKNRPLSTLPAVSFMVPCYNDADTVGLTVTSIFETLGPDADVLVIDDGSTDGSLEKLLELKKTLGFTLVQNAANIGKSKTLNTHFPAARHDIVVLVDADVIVSMPPLADALARLQRPEVGAVSCPYRSANPGFIAMMQTLEYNMLSFIQGAYNVFSAVALWGGFIVIKRKAFLKVGGFSLNAITEDMDLAFKLNANGWRVEQSFLPIRTFVPDTIRKWFKQKIRWSSGGLQCFIKYHRVWMKNPLHVLFVLSFCVLLTFSTLNIGRNLFLLDDIIRYFDLLHQSGNLWLSLQSTIVKFGGSILKDVGWRVCLTLFSLPFVLPLISTIKRMHICFLVIPFSMVYIPAFSFISILGALAFLRKRRFLQSAGRAW